MLKSLYLCGKMFSEAVMGFIGKNEQITNCFAFLSSV